MYLLGSSIVLEWELLAGSQSFALADLDLLIIEPDGTTTYIDSPIAPSDYTPPTQTANGRVFYTIIPNKEGFWRIRLVEGTSLSYRILSKVEMYVFDNSTVVEPSTFLYAIPDEKSLSLPNEIHTVIGTIRWYPVKQIRIQSVIASLGIPAQGQDVIIDVKKNNISILSSNIVIPANAAQPTTNPQLSVIVNPTEYITVDILQVGSSYAGSDLVVNFKYI